MAELSSEVFDAIEFDAAYTGDHRSAAEEMSLLADSGTQSATMPRSEAHVRAGEQWLLADEPSAAVHRFQRALDDGGPSSVDPRVPLARALFMLGRADDANEIIGSLAREPAIDPRLCDQMAELLMDHGELTAAVGWATAGVRLLLGEPTHPIHPPQTNGRPAPASAAPSHHLADVARLSASDLTELRLLLSLRFRIRNDLGLAEDAYDRLLDELPAVPAGPAATG